MCSIRILLRSYLFLGDFWVIFPWSSAFLVSFFWTVFIFLIFANMLLIFFTWFLSIRIIILTTLQVLGGLILLILFSGGENFQQNGRKRTNIYLALLCAKYCGRSLISSFNFFLHDIISFLYMIKMRFRALISRKAYELWQRT